ncbi:hypothetical protein [Pseudorhodoferax sp. Leaf267]|uniref:hypothetical protein n=1 Tax=Pseudorhodoferax sp. Leaf267 TaxID=1736316 RepID=UPI0012E13FA1|nr:hypothetical protein [Pseudorhodoferax sp. Leaf267]
MAVLHGVLLVANAGPLIVLGLADLLAPVAVPAAVLAECLERPSLPSAAQIQTALADGHLQPVLDGAHVAPGTSLHGLGTGELGVLAYAQAHGLTALVDERRARRTAQRLGLRLIGSGALLVATKRAALIPSVKTVLDLWAAHGYCVADAVRQALLAAAGK